MAITLDGTTGITTPGLTNTGTETIVNLTTTGNTILGDASTDTLNVGNGGLIKDASGNVGIGVTPSAWSTGKAIEVGQGGSGIFSYAAGNSYFTMNCNYNTGWKYTASNYASYYQQLNGYHFWYTAPLGTAGNPITFTQAMTLDASGNLFVGQTAIGNGGTVAVNGTISICNSTTGLQTAMAKDGTQQTSSISTTAVTIFTSIIQGLSSAAAGVCYVYGSNNAGANFLDVVTVFPSGTPSVLHSTTLSGAPAARTYTMSTNALRLAMASGTYSVNVKLTTLGYPF